MTERDENAKAQIKVRLRGALRDWLGAEAKRRGQSLNAEIERRLEASVRNSAAADYLFGDDFDGDDISKTLETMANIIRGLEKFSLK